MVVAAGCSDNGEPAKTPVAEKGDVTLVIGAYSVVKDVFADLLPEFKKEWKERTGQTVVFQESYEASGTQARSIIGGFEADVTLLAMEGDMDKIEKAGMITHDWKAAGAEGMVTRSIAVLGTRAGNPLGIQDWTDLTKPGVKVLYPNPKTSGGAQWDINAIYGAGLKESERRSGKPDPEYAKRFLASVHENVESLDKSGRASMAAFEYGVGDVIVTYENELLARIRQGIDYNIVIPEDTILIENPAALIDRNVDKHGSREVAEAFIEFLHGEKAQMLFMDYGFRPVNEKVMAMAGERFTEPKGLFDIHYLGGWDEVRSRLYSPRGVWYQVLAGI
ncbi:sulfate ABC transporter substrate-binding protein [Paenibacillus pinihumi]|uniref:sulfate ABC transporter substrate-binding protein n=1 Tax=Paenibacillus pinihumi TaxID=669462 RepID=UPI0012B62029|nr:sulfate ABC transporter substrate-binding protein [Paenibacillus pinihumi]